ncbi:helicase [Undibacterium sp. FT79W]|jgi:hypothetical protein|uniref:helicase n=1 Tax=Undibacterium sp. FT79W TaxID=2762296 RepID=UPI00164C1493|nr:helicase [Undibacterium sp. FT79W]MBC3877339.1 helicase [Undibacterium sp. FT79W]
MLKFKLLLWFFNQLLRRQINNNPLCGRYVQGKVLVFQICTASGVGRYYEIRSGTIRSFSGLAPHPQFTFTFSDAVKGFEILSAKDSQAAFIRGVGSKDLVVSGDFREVMWFQGLSAFLQPPKVFSPYDRTVF